MLLAHHVYEADLEEQLPKLRYPVFMQTKYDGFRLTKSRSRGVCVTRTGLRPYCQQLRNFLDDVLLPGMEGEVTYGSTWSDTQQLMSSRDYTVDLNKLTVRLFDYGMALNAPYYARLDKLREITPVHDQLRVVANYTAYTPGEVLDFYRKHEYFDWPANEGIILRDPKGFRLNKRSTFKEQYLIAIKPREKGIAICIGYNEQKNLSGQPTGRLGSLLCKFNGVEFSVGSGFTDDLRGLYWRNRDKLIGSDVEFYYLPVSNKIAPRQPVFSKIMEYS